MIFVVLMIFMMIFYLIKIDNWFHFECINMKKNEVRQLDHYYCDKCIEWGTITENFFKWVLKFDKILIK